MIDLRGMNDMSKRTLYEDLLIKLAPIFPRDVYIVKCTFIISGDAGEAHTIGKYMCKLHEKYIKAASEVLDKDKIYYISDLKNYKKAVAEGIPDPCYLWEVSCKDDIKEINKAVYDMFNKVLFINEWDKFDFNNDEITALYKDRESINIFKDKPVCVSKSIFPSITEKEIDNAYYYREDMDDLGMSRFIISMDKPMFQLFMIYTYVWV